MKLEDTAAAARTTAGTTLVTWRPTQARAFGASDAGRHEGEASATANFQSFTRTVAKGQAAAILPNAELTKFKLGEDKSIVFAKNIGGTPVGLELGGHSILFSNINDIGSSAFTGELKGAGSVGGGPEVWFAGRAYDKDFKPVIHKDDGTLIDLSDEHANGSIPKDDSTEALLMHGRGFTTDKWKFSDPVFDEATKELAITKTLNFKDDPTCAKFGPGKLEITYKLGTNPDTGNDRLRTSIKASSTEPGQKAYLSSMALHYFFKATAGDILTSTAQYMHRVDPKNPARPEMHKGFQSIEAPYDFSRGVNILDGTRRENIITNFAGAPGSLKEAAKLEREDYTLIIRQQAQLGGKFFPNGLLVFNAGPKGTVCLEPYFGMINGQNRLISFQENSSNIKSLTVGAEQGDFEATVDLELIPKTKS